MFKNLKKGKKFQVITNFHASTVQLEVAELISKIKLFI